MDVITKNLARGLIKTMGAEKISGMANSLLSEVTAQKKAIPLLDDETDIIGVIYSMNDIAYFAQAAIKEADNGNTEICRFLEVKPITEMLQKLLENI